VHVKNGSWHAVETLADGTVRWENRWEELPTGQADVHGYLRTLREVRYDEWVTLEDFSTARPLAERTAHNLAHLRAGL
jgi:sugar phosphate isomerase/epimerase